MGQALSADLLTQYQLPPLSVRNNSVRTFNFRKLPTELIDLIFEDFLDPVTATALSLTCKDLRNGHYRVPQRLNLLDRRLLLLLLENDSTSQRPVYFCHHCVGLHSFDPVREGPTHPSLPHFKFGPDDWPLAPYGRLNDCCQDIVRVDGNNFVIEYRHVRLIMNQHFYGGAGLPLSTFNVTCRPEYDDGRWSQKWSARIIDDELFLSATHTLNYRGSKGDFREIVNRSECNICAHVKLNELWTIFGGDVSGAEGTPARSWPRRNFLEPCGNVHHVCISCATDFTITVEERSEPERWVLTIVTYHQLGSCRYPNDPRWVAFRGGRRFHSVPTPLRDTFGIMPGSVREKWRLLTLKREYGLFLP
ncbi:hypothetical protein F4821DRAFT_274094 [Hypoxylon rubiginosum]|uniref:Uncharacterized protein n=1 Tax=Hypoxylon rubiginosum TaxID=110542 RepID=A0ACC0DKV3_9PEZI|nr:hypothetical protein F4821DRAFT_274094 [Hypoxylon rubiginosum]